MDSSVLVGVLQDLGVNISASAIYDFLKIHGVKAEAAAVIKAFADSGFLSIKGAELVAPDGILIGAGEGALFSFGENSASKTAKTAIHANGSARVEGSNAAVNQNADGSISQAVNSRLERPTNHLDNHPKPYSLTLSSTQALREWVRNLSPLHHQYSKSQPLSGWVFFRPFPPETPHCLASVTTPKSAFLPKAEQEKSREHQYPKPLA
jgi:hypothetical protein